MAFYSIIPLPITAFLFVLFFGGGFKALALVLLTLLLNISVFWASLVLALKFTRNLSLFNFKKIFLISLVGVFIPNLFSFFSQPLLFSEPPYSIPPLAFYIPPVVYNFITQFIFPGIITFLLLYLLLKRRVSQKILLVCLVVAIVNLPWGYLPSIKKEIENPQRNTTLSPSRVSEFEKKIKIQAVREDVVSGTSPNAASLEVMMRIDAPLAGSYRITYLVGYSREGGSYSYDVPVREVILIVNGSESSEGGDIRLKTGPNVVALQLQDIFSNSKSRSLSHSDFERFMQGQELIERNIYGPYQVRLHIYSVIPETGGGIVPLQNVKFSYTTKEYNPQNLPPNVLYQNED